MISTRAARLSRNQRKVSTIRRHWKVLTVAGCVVALIIAGVLLLVNQQPASAEAPEAGKVLDVQSKMPFQILIPSYLPRPFDRARAEIDVDQDGPGGEPMVQIAYRTRRDEAALFVRQWVPVNPDKEVLAGSRPIQTKWGRGYLLTQSAQGMIALWLDIGPLRVSVYTESTDVVSREMLLNIGETMGPASNAQVFSFSLEQPQIKDVAPPPPFEVKVNDAGIQDFSLIVTPGGYSPTRFLVRKGIPVRLTYRALGQVGSGMTLIFNIDDTKSEAVELLTQDDVKTIEFTPEKAGNFEFFCSHRMYRGIMTVIE